jgi:hypothetical protein
MRFVPKKAAQLMETRGSVPRAEGRRGYAAGIEWWVGLPNGAFLSLALVHECDIQVHYKQYGLASQLAYSHSKESGNCQLKAYARMAHPGQSPVVLEFRDIQHRRPIG